MENPSPIEPAPALVIALRRLLRPLVRLLLSHQVTYPFLSNLLKGIYVEVADREFEVPGKRQTDSRITLLTGVHRKDVRRLRNPTEDAGPPPRAVSLGGQIIARWTGDELFLTGEGRPRKLPRQGSDEAGPGFETLVEEISRQDVRARAALDELVRLGVVRVDEDDYVHLQTEAFVPDKAFDEKVYYFGQNLRDHIAAGVHNLEEEAPPFLDRSVYYSDLSDASAGTLAELARTLGMQALQEMNRTALRLKKSGAKKKTSRHRINFGTFFYTEEQPGSPLDDDHDT